MATTRTMTIEELAQLPEDEARFELLDGELIARPWASSHHAATLTNVVLHVGGYIRSHGLGASLAGGTGFVLAREPGTLLCPDFAYVSGCRAAQLPHFGQFIDRSPDFVIEIIDADDLYWVVEGKNTRYFEAGVSVVWLLDPQTQTVTSCDASGKRQWFVGDEIVGGELELSEFCIQAAEFFTY